MTKSQYDKGPTKQVRDGKVWLIGDAAHPMCPFQRQDANMGMVDELKLAHFFCALAANPAAADNQAAVLEKEIGKRGRKAVLESRNSAKQFHVTNPVQRSLRNMGFQIGNAMIK